MAFDAADETLKEIVQSLVEVKAKMRSMGSTLESIAPLADNATSELLIGMSQDLFEKASVLNLLAATHSKKAFGAK